MTRLVQIHESISYTSEEARRFTAVLECCETCGKKLTQEDLRALAIGFGNDASDDNLVFDCYSCAKVSLANGKCMVELIQEIISQVEAELVIRRFLEAISLVD